jgi:hypothetical protein
VVKQWLDDAGPRSWHADGQLPAGAPGEISQGPGDVGQRVGPLYRDGELAVHHVRGQPSEDPAGGQRGDRRDLDGAPVELVTRQAQGRSDAATGHQQVTELARTLTSTSPSSGSRTGRSCRLGGAPKSSMAMAFIACSFLLTRDRSRHRTLFRSSPAATARAILPLDQAAGGRRLRVIWLPAAAAASAAITVQ